MQTKLIIGILIILALVAGFFLYQKPVSEPETLKIGAVLPLTGSTAIYGESIRNGMEIAKSELESQGIPVELFYEDSEGQSAEGVSAYRTLVDVRGVDVVISVFSRVSVPLISLADSDKLPLIMTVVSATGAPAESQYAFRFYNTAAQYVEPYFETILNTSNYNSIAIIYINDEFGVSVRDAVNEEATKNEIEVITEESFVPGASDFRTQLVNVKNANPDAILFVAFAPAEANNLIQQARELGITQDMFDGSSILSSADVRKGLGSHANNTFTTLFPFDLGKTGEEFRTAYVTEYENNPFFAAPFGYDTVKFITDVSNGEKISGNDFIRRISQLDSAESLNGTLQIDSTGEINPSLSVAEIIDGELVEVK